MRKRVNICLVCAICFFATFLSVREARALYPFASCDTSVRHVVAGSVRPHASLVRFPPIHVQCPRSTRVYVSEATIHSHAASIVAVQEITLSTVPANARHRVPVAESRVAAFLRSSSRPGRCMCGQL